MELTFEQLPNAVGQILESLARIENLLRQRDDSTSNSDNPGSILTVHEAAEFLNITSSTIYKHTFRRAMPHVKKGKRLYFVKSELIE